MLYILRLCPAAVISWDIGMQLGSGAEDREGKGVEGKEGYSIDEEAAACQL